MILSAQEIAAATGGRLIRSAPPGELLTDTRALRPGSWFVALQGPRFDGHDFLDKAAEAGAAGAVLSREVPGWTGGLVVVPDTTQAFGALGCAARRKLPCPVIGLTGTSGKTTTRALIALALSPLGPVHQTVANLNNHLGVPMTLLAAPPSSAAVVVEMGTSGPGEIETLALIAEPSHRLVINIGHGHLEELGDIEGVGREKLAMFATARPGDLALINLDDPRTRAADLPDGVRSLTYGRDEAAAIRLLQLELHPETLSTRVWIQAPSAEVEVVIPAFGVPFALNATAAIAVAEALGVPLAEAAEAMGRYAPVGMRQKIERLTSGALILNDAYNANPDSVKAALSTLAALPGRSMAILGDMLELGAHEQRLHAEVLDHASSLGVERIWVVGERFARAAESFSGVQAADADRVIEALSGTLGPSDRVLVKGSRGMRLERIVQGLSKPTSENR